MRRSTLNTAGRKHRQRIGMLASSLRWSYGTRMIHHYMSRMVCIFRFPHPSLTHAGLVAHHRFNTEEADWGFTRFCELRRLFHQTLDGRDRSLVENDEAYLTAYVRVVKDPTGVLWHSFQKYVRETYVLEHMTDKHTQL